MNVYGYRFFCINRRAFIIFIARLPPYLMNMKEGIIELMVCLLCCFPCVCRDV